LSKILVTGASGNLGRLTLLSLLKRRPASDLVGLVRDPGRASDLAALGIELRQGDYAEPASLELAFEGIDKLMLTATHAFTDRKTSHANVIEAAVKTGVNHLVFMPIARNPDSDFAMKEITDEDLFTESRLVESGLTYTLAYHPPFMDAVGVYIGANAQENGVRVPRGKGRFAAASRDDLAEAHAAILTGTGHENASYTLTGDPAVSFAEVAGLLTKIHGWEVPYEGISDEEYMAIKRAEGFPDFIITFVLRWIEGMNAGEWQRKTGDLEQLIGRKPKTAEDYLRTNYNQSTTS
jgi:NAD(P)H dehydrogenase (quinone)